jgi:hypothetical protein
MTASFKKLSEVQWEPHFMTDNGKIRWIYTREKDNSPITVMQVRLEKGVTLPDHVHRDRGQSHDVHRRRRRISSRGGNDHSGAAQHPACNPQYRRRRPALQCFCAGNSL